MDYVGCRIIPPSRKESQGVNWISTKENQFVADCFPLGKKARV